MEQVELHPIAETYGDQFEVRTKEGEVVGIMARKHLIEVSTNQLARVALSTVEIEGGSALVVYEQRTPPGVGGSDDALCIEIGQERIRLSKRAAHELACVLLAYAAPGNSRYRWMVRLESGQV